MPENYTNQVLGNLLQAGTLLASINAKLGGKEAFGEMKSNKVKLALARLTEGLEDDVVQALRKMRQANTASMALARKVGEILEDPRERADFLLPIEDADLIDDSLNQTQKDLRYLARFSDEALQAENITYQSIYDLWVYYLSIRVRFNQTCKSLPKLRRFVSSIQNIQQINDFVSQSNAPGLISFLRKGA